MAQLHRTPLPDPRFGHEHPHAGTSGGGGHVQKGSKLELFQY